MSGIHAINTVTKNIVCETCYFSFINEVEFERHLKIHYEWEASGSKHKRRFDYVAYSQAKEWEALCALIIQAIYSGIRWESRPRIQIDENWSISPPYVLYNDDNSIRRIIFTRRTTESVRTHINTFNKASRATSNMIVWTLYGKTCVYHEIQCISSQSLENVLRKKGEIELAESIRELRNSKYLSKKKMSYRGYIEE